MVDTEWLDDHPDSQTAYFITGFTKAEPEEDTGFDGGDEDGDNLKGVGGDWQTGCIDPALQATFQESDEGDGSNFEGSTFGSDINAGDDDLDEHLREDFGDGSEDENNLYA